MMEEERGTSGGGSCTFTFLDGRPSVSHDGHSTRCSHPLSSRSPPGGGGGAEGAPGELFAAVISGGITHAAAKCHARARLSAAYNCTCHSTPA